MLEAACSDLVFGIRRVECCLRVCLTALAVAVHEKLVEVPREQCELVEFLHHIDGR